MLRSFYAGMAGARSTFGGGFDGGLQPFGGAPAAGDPGEFPGFLPPQAKKDGDEDDPPAGEGEGSGKGKGKGGAGGEDEEDDDPDEGKGGAGGDGGKGKGKGKPEGSVSREEHEAALARVRASGARRLRRMRGEFEQRMDELESRLGSEDDPAGDDDEGADEGAGKGAGKGKGKTPAAKPSGSPVLQRQLEQERQKRRALEERVRLDSALGTVRAAARKAGAHSEDVVDILRGRLSFESEAADAAAFVRMEVDGQPEDLSLEEAVDELLKQRPHLKRAAKRPQGSGSRGARGGAPGGSGGGSGAEKPKTFEQAGAAMAERLRSLGGSGS